MECSEQQEAQSCTISASLGENSLPRSIGHSEQPPEGDTLSQTDSAEKDCIISPARPSAAILEGLSLGTFGILSTRFFEIQKHSQKYSQ